MQTYYDRWTAGLEKKLDDHVMTQYNIIANNYKYDKDFGNGLTSRIQEKINILYSMAKYDKPAIVISHSPEEAAVYNIHLSRHGFSSQPMHSWLWNKFKNSMILSYRPRNLSEAPYLIAAAPFLIPIFAFGTLANSLIYISKSPLHKRRHEYLKKELMQQVKDPELKNLPYFEQVSLTKQSAYLNTRDDLNIRDVLLNMWENIHSQLKGKISNSFNNDILKVIYRKVYQPITNVKKSISGYPFEYRNLQNWGFEKPSWKKDNDPFVDSEFGIISDLELIKFSFLEKLGAFQNETFSSVYFPLVSQLWSIKFFRKFVLVTTLPKKISFDENNELHSMQGLAVQWPHNAEFDRLFNKEYDYYFIHGVNFEMDIWKAIVNASTTTTTTNEISVKQVIQLLRINNMEQRSQLIKIIGIDNILRKLDAQLISSFVRRNQKNSRSRHYIRDVELSKLKDNQVRLYRVSSLILEIDNEDGFVLFVVYHDPSTERIYLDFIDPEIITKPNNDKENLAARAMSWKMGIDYSSFMNYLVAET